MENVEKIYEVLTNKQFVRQRPKGEFKKAVLDKIETAARNRSLIKIVLGFGCHKNPNACSSLLPDIAEEAAMRQLVKWAEEVRKSYSPGMEIKIITSSRRAEIVNGMNPDNTLAYHFALQGIIRHNGWQEIIEVIPIGDLYDEFYQDFQEALKNVREETKPDWDDSFWIQQAEHAKRNIYQKGLSEEELLEKSKKAAYNYVVYHRAEMEAGLLEKKFPGGIRASYNRHDESIVLWTTAKGNVTQPWQGKGILGSDGRITVITQKRKGGE